MVLTKNGENDDYIVPTKTRGCAPQSPETDEIDENGGCPSDKTRVCQEHRFRHPDRGSFADLSSRARQRGQHAKPGATYYTLCPQNRPVHELVHGRVEGGETYDKYPAAPEHYKSYYCGTKTVSVSVSYCDSFRPQYRHIRDYYLSNSKTFQDGNGNGNFDEINSNDFLDGNWESMEIKGRLRGPRR